MLVALHYGIDHPERVRAILSLASRSTIAVAPPNAGMDASSAGRIAAQAVINQPG